MIQTVTSVVLYLIVSMLNDATSASILATTKQIIKVLRYVLRHNTHVAIVLDHMNHNSVLSIHTTTLPAVLTARITISLTLRNTATLLSIELVLPILLNRINLNDPSTSITKKTNKPHTEIR